MSTRSLHASTTARGSSWPAYMICVGLALLYLGERALDGRAQQIADLSGLFALGLGMCGALLRARHGNAFVPIFINYIIVCIGLLLYACLRFSWLLPEDVIDPETAKTLLRTTFAPVILLGLLPALLQERAASSMASGTAQAEAWRLKLAQRSAHITYLGIVSFAALNYAANVWNRKVDLSYFKTTAASESTQNIVRNLSTDVQMTLFFPPSNEVLEQARAYLTPLAALSRHLQLRQTDQALEPDLARRLKVRGNGYLALEAGERSELLRLDPDLEMARPALRSLDVQVQERLLKLLQPGRIAYLTTGHHERDFAPAQGDSRPGLAEFKQLLEHQGFSIRRLGLAEGLGQAVPEDATAVIVAGPSAALGDMERAALQAFVQGGGHLLVALDPEHGDTEDKLLAPWGLRCSRALVAHDKFLVRVPGRHESKYDLVTNRAGQHAITAGLAQSGGRMGVVLLGAGSLRKLSPAPPDAPELTFALHAMPASFLDVGKKGKFNGDPHSRENLEFAAALKGPDKDGKPGGRVVVFADADLMTDGVLSGSPGNTLLLIDTMVWLGGEMPKGEAPRSEEDVPLLHRKQDDALWFYGISFAMPAIVLTAGVLLTRRRKKPRRRQREASDAQA